MSAVSLRTLLLYSCMHIESRRYLLHPHPSVHLPLNQSEVYHLSMPNTLDLEAEQRELINAIVRLQNKVHLAECITPSMLANHRLVEFAVKELGLGIKRGDSKKGPSIVVNEAEQVAGGLIIKQVVKPPTIVDSLSKEVVIDKAVPAPVSQTPESTVSETSSSKIQIRPETVPKRPHACHKKEPERKASGVFDDDDGGSSSDFSQGWDDEEAAALERLESAMIKGTEVRE